MAEEIVNKVKKSRTLLLDLEEHYPQGERVQFDLKPFLHEGLVIIEKEFRAAVEAHDWEQYEGKYVAVNCSTDAIVPAWAYMLVAGQLSEHAAFVAFGSEEDLENTVFEHLISNLDLTEYENQRVIIKGCSKLPVPQHAYVRLAQLLSSRAKAVMYGEPCSTVPIYKKRRR